MSALLDVPAVLQIYSRLVIDCNRPEHAAGAFPEVSEATVIPGNAGLDEVAKAARPIRERRASIDDATVTQIIKEGTAKARTVASQTLADVKRAMKLL